MSFRRWDIFNHQREKTRLEILLQNVRKYLDNCNPYKGKDHEDTLFSIYTKLEDHEDTLLSNVHSFSWTLSHWLCEQTGLFLYRRPSNGTKVVQKTCMDRRCWVQAWGDTQ
ncbi:hypothetical protein ERO13_D01G072050v2 [Gossypium hirsutum]|uniref:Uncharacterized protein n=4 Tax=Gossypium TaxID=3633 RepID=A0A5J5SLY8_GOSBA|nr:hypothetical protein ES319_D01G088500v1 [Gossypium barbadense]KAG4161701.1 hypothetical protein ERO13_D01G072050v2 [Gossypium hirsutum]TYG82543.1 hypothetical protein ES288_D01G097400v1 [Gossypium darwinii]TYH87127.1 hypothetical protein ES332_D01G094600v1 [Gossypium tomentosum]TYI96729.1 hypothetical protein E1A91_D01G093900v1 [Gossypium mustelinum]